MDDIFFHKKGKSILLSLNKRDGQNVTEIAGSIEGTYAHTFNLLKEMERLGIIKSTKEGRTKYVKLTSRGERLAKIVMDFENTLKKKGKKIAPARTTPTHEKLEKYKDSLELISSEVKSKKLGKKDTGKYSRILGRYKSLVGKLRPKDKAGKSQKSDLRVLIGEIDSILKKKK
jgi:DNA-binding MarR family transcriptional regulator